MNIQDAIKEAGPGGKIKRAVWGADFWTLPNESYQKVEPIHGTALCTGNLIADDWEVVAEERIEVGDEIKSQGHMQAFKVVAISQGQACGIGLLDEHLNTFNLSRATLIRKGSKRHVFEGVELKGSAVDPWINLADLYCKGLPGIAKTYRMTLEEME